MRSSLIKVMIEPKIGEDKLVPKYVNCVRLVKNGWKAPLAETWESLVSMSIVV